MTNTEYHPKNIQNNVYLECEILAHKPDGWTEEDRDNFQYYVIQYMEDMNAQTTCMVKLTEDKSDG